MSFTEVYKQVLVPFLKNYNDAENEKLKKAVLKNAAASVVKNREELEIKEDLPKDLERVSFFLFCIILIYSLHFFPALGHSSIFQKKNQQGFCFGGWGWQTS